MMWCSAVGFIATLILSLLAAPLTVTAQPRSTVPRIGILPPAAAASAPSLEAFRQGLRDLSLSSTLVVTIDSAAHQAYCTPELVGLASSHLGSGERSGQGHISREIFVNEAIYQQEQEQIFARTWLLVGHESQIPTPGAYFVSCMGEESVILTRDSRQQVHVFLNTCRHRGMKVCRYDEGNTTVFTCPYHGWSYATDGRLVGVPYYKEAYRERLDRSQWGLVEVAQLMNYKGTIWATWDATAPPFLDYVGEMKLSLDTVLDCPDGREGGSEVIGGVQKWLMPCNWKFAAENFAGDAYHNISHRSVDLVGIGPSGRGRRDTEERTSSQRVATSFPALGHGATSFLQLEDVPYAPSYRDTPGVEAYFKHCYEERQRRLGKGRC